MDFVMMRISLLYARKRRKKYLSFGTILVRIRMDNPNIVSSLPNIHIMKTLTRSFIFTFYLFGFIVSSYGQVPVWDDPTNNFDSYKKSRIQQSSLNENPLLNDYDVKFYWLDIEANSTSDHIAGNVSILAEVVNNPLSTLVVELIDALTVDSVLINGDQAIFTHANEEINISLPQPAAIGEKVTAKIYYGGLTGDGMFTGVDGNWEIPVTATLSEPFYAKDWFPCKQNLGDKADSVYVFVTTDYGLEAASNGLRTGTTFLPNGKIRHEWKSNYPIAFYLISIAVSDYVEYNIEALPPGGDPILIQNFVYDVEGCLEHYQDDIDVTKDIMDVFTELFGPYPFRNEKYGHYLWPWGGGMEHQTMTGMGNFSFYLIAHELGHSWFGDYVTCATWQDIWINEGFATYAGYVAVEKLIPGYAFEERASIFERAMREAEGSVYVPAAQAENDSRIFSGNLSYRKGMTLLYMIRYILDDDELFYKSLRDYLAVYADSVATGLDFKEELEASSGVDFTNFFDQWYFGYGFPSFDVSWEQLGQTVTIYSNQTTSSANTTLFQIPVEYMLKWSGGDTLVRVDHEINNEVYTFEIDHPVLGVDVDPNNHIVDGEGSVKQLAGIESFEQHFTLYPNPSSEYFTVSPQEEWTGELCVEIINELNQVVYREDFDHHAYDKHVIRPNVETTGFYIVRIISGSQVEMHKIIIN